MESIRVILNSIKSQKFRSFLTVLGISIGTFSVVLIGTISDIGKSVINNELDSIGVNGLSITNSSDNTDDLSLEVLYAIKSSDMVLDVTPITFSYSNVESKGSKKSAVVMGVDYNAEKIISLNLLHGKLIGKSDVKGAKQVCVVDEAFAREIYKRSNIVGKKVWVDLDGREIECEVIGVVKTGGNIIQSMIESYAPGFVYIPYTTKQLYTGSDKFDQIAVRLKNGEDAGVAKDTLLKDLRNKPLALRVDNLSGYKEEFNIILNGVSAILGVIAGISLIVAGLSIMTVMMVSVNERTKEIGIKKSIGASSGRIVREFILEAFLLSLIGGSIGAVGGSLLGIIASFFIGTGVIINIKLIIGTVIFAISIGIIFGVYPAIKASKLRPADALRRG